MSEHTKLKRESYGDLVILALVVPFVDEDQMLGKLLGLSKQANLNLKSKIYQHALLWCQPERLLVKRNQIWLHVLDVKQMDVNYKELKQTVDLNREMIANVDEVIMLDVARSEHQMPNVDP